MVAGPVGSLACCCPGWRVEQVTTGSEVARIQSSSKKIIEIFAAAGVKRRKKEDEAESTADGLLGRQRSHGPQQARLASRTTEVYRVSKIAAWVP